MKCETFNSLQSFLLNLTLHVVILFTILGFIFMFYISNVMKSTIRGQIKDIINDSFSKFIFSLNKQELNEFNTFLYSNKEYFNNLQKIYAEPSEATTINNNWVNRSIISTICLLLIIVLIAIIIIKFRCGYNVHITRILIINIIIFFFVGMTELLFFINVITQYIPIKPSYITKKIYTQLQKLFA